MFKKITKNYKKHRVIRKLKSLLEDFDDQELYVGPEDWLKRAKRLTEEDFFGRNPKIRTLIAQILVKWRKRKPYVPQYAESKKLYDEYFEMEGHIPNFESLKVGDYVVKFRSDAPVKGDRYSEYYTNSSGFPNRFGTCKLKSKNEKYNYFNFEVDSYGEGLSEDFFTSFRYATKEEIEQYKKDIAHYRELEKKIEEGFKKVGKLQKQKSKIFNG